MADCIEALITANLKAACATVTVANGYNTACGTVEEMRSLFKLPDAMPFTMLQKLPSNTDEDYQHTEDEKIRYALYYFNGANDERPNNPIQYADRNVAADFQKAIMVDRTRGANAQNTEVESAWQGSFMDAEGNVLPCTFLNIAVQALLNADDPYQLA